MASNAVEKRTRTEPDGVDPADEPSAEWGWHGGFPRAAQAAGWASAAILLIMLLTLDMIGVATAWLIALIVGIVGGLLLDIRKRRLSWRR